MEIYRTKLKKEILCEFVEPQIKSKEVKALILASGLPSMPKKDETLEFWSKKGYWVFFPRYRGTFESDSELLQKSPAKDVLDTVDAIQKGFSELWGGKKFSPKFSKIYVLGRSFGGGSAIYAGLNKEVTKAVAICPVIDWREPSEIEPLPELGRFLKVAWGNMYRFKNENWKKLIDGKIYNPISEIEKLPTGKVLIIHAKDDEVVPYQPTKEFCDKTGAKLITLKSGGHDFRLLPKFYKTIDKFFNS